MPAVTDAAVRVTVAVALVTRLMSGAGYATENGPADPAPPRFGASELCGPDYLVGSGAIMTAVAAADDSSESPTLLGEFGPVPADSEAGVSPPPAEQWLHDVGAIASLTAGIETDLVPPSFRAGVAAGAPDARPG